MGTASAVVTYSYSGNNFTTVVDWPSVGGTYSNSMSVSGSMTLGAPLAPNLLNQGIAPLSFSFGDGRNTLTHASSFSSQSFYVSTNALGDLTNWSIYLQTPLNIEPIRAILSSNDGSLVVDQGSIVPFAGSADSAETAQPGIWNLVPEPSTAALLAAGLMLATFKRIK
jgi:hypothetical protein